jgi:hypothetical protein
VARLPLLTQNWHTPAACAFMHVARSAVNVNRGAHAACGLTYRSSYLPPPPPPP